MPLSCNTNLTTRNDFVSFTVADDIRAWLPINGGDSNDRTAGPFIGLIGQGECNYGWVSGEPLEYTYWHPVTPESATSLFANFGNMKANVVGRITPWVLKLGIHSYLNGLMTATMTA